MFIIGSIPYMSPEQASGKALDARSDIFSFGAVLYEMLTGIQPFRAESELELLERIVEVPAEPLHDEIPLLLRIAVEKALEKDPADRYQSMRDLVVDPRRAARQRQEEIASTRSVSARSGTEACSKSNLAEKDVVPLITLGVTTQRSGTPDDVPKV